MSARVTPRFASASITAFDTAEGYGDGESERVLGRLLGAKRDDVLIATKILPKPDQGPEQIRQAIAVLARVWPEVTGRTALHPVEEREAMAAIV